MLEWTPRAWPLVSAASAAAAALVTRWALRRGWSAAFDEEPPQNPAARDASGRAALLRAAVSGLAAGVNIAARRLAAGAWVTATGDEPPID